jgi:hypothetical protein
MAERFKQLLFLLYADKKVTVLYSVWGFMKLLDLCCRLKGAPQDFKDNGWGVLTVDFNPKFNPDIVADINDLQLEGDFDLTGHHRLACEGYQ